jgi:quinol monooxygenase YgiN
MSTEMTFFARFHVRAGCEPDMIAALVAVRDPTRAEPGCRAYRSYQSIADPRLFCIQSTWTSEADFDRHATFDHTVRFIARAEDLADSPPDFLRTRALPPS